MNNRLVAEKSLLSRYVDLARKETAVTFVGRLGTYRYLDMDVTIREALDCGRRHLECLANGSPAPVFSAPPI